MRRALFVVLAVCVIGLIAVTSVPAADSGPNCQVDHIAESPNKTVTVKVCDSVNGSIGAAWYTNDTVLIEKSDVMALTYVHELGHMMYLNHDTTNGTVMSPSVDMYDGRTNVSTEIANNYNTTDVTDEGISTPYGLVD